jgi:hypothetical protein
LLASWPSIDAQSAPKLDELEGHTQPNLPQDLAPDDTNERFIIITQQCDLVREPSREPTLEVVGARWDTDPAITGNLRGLKSWRELVVAEVKTGNVRQALVADSRRRSLLDKRALFALPARQALPDNADSRRRFAYWAGARYYRRPVPNDLAVCVERPLREAVRKNARMKTLAQEFNMFVLVEESDGLRLYGIFEREEDGDRLEREFAEASETVPFVGLTAEDCEVRHITQAPMAWAFGTAAYQLGLEGQSGGDDAVPPALET